MALSELEASFQMIATAKALLSEAALPGTRKEDRKITMSENNVSTVVLNGTSTPAFEGVVALSLTMTTAVPYSLDLTAAPQPGGEPNISLAGKKLIGAIWSTPASNASTIEIAPADTNGYDLWMTASGIRVPKHENHVFLNQVALRDDVDGTNKIIEFDGQTGDVIDIFLFFGT